MEEQKTVEPKCKNCLLFDSAKRQCKVAILSDGRQYHMPVDPDDYCHMDALNIPVQQVRWWVEDPKTGKPTSGDGIVKVEYPVGFFGDDSKKAGASKI